MDFSLTWTDFSDSKQLVFTGRTSLRGNQDLREHRHDFFECFLVEAGPGAHSILGEEAPLNPGELWFIRPEHVHGFRAVRGHALTLLNVALQAREVEAVLARRLLPAGVWKQGRGVFNRTLQQREREAFSHLVQEVSQSPRETIDASYFLFGLGRIVRRWQRADAEVKVPDWMEGLSGLEADLDLLQGGLPVLLRRCSRSHEHVSRCFRKYWGQTPSDWLNRRRVGYAQQLLETTQMPVIEVAFACGFESLSYFHRVFKQRIQQTPLAYRKRAQSVQGTGSSSGTVVGR